MLCGPRRGQRYGVPAVSTVSSHSAQGGGKVSKGSKSIAMRLGAWVADLSRDQVPEEALHIAPRCIVDTMSVAVAGSRGELPPLLG